MRHTISYRRWKKALRLLQASAFFSDRQSITPVDIILLKECLWHDPASYQLINQQFELLMVEQGYQQQAILTKIQTFNRQKRQHIAQSQAQRALTLTPAKTLMSRKPHYSLPASLTEPVLTFLLQTPLVTSTISRSSVMPCNSG